MMHSKKGFAVITTMYVQWSAESQEVLARKVVHENRPVVPVCYWESIISVGLVN